MHPKVLIIATTPYSENFSSRSLDTYFHFWEKENVAQIFTRNIVPTKGHCGELYQITDSKLLKRWFHKTKDTGNVYYYDNLDKTGMNQVIENGAMQKLGTKHTPTIELMRRLLWRKKYWCTDQLNEWLDKFQPECIFYNFSNHIFTQQIALYVADRYNIPIITAIADDFFFANQKSFSPAFLLYKRIFKKLTRKVLNRKNSSAIYISDKINDKYEGTFNLNGKTIYLNSTIDRKKFSAINKESPVIAYFGNIRLGRNKSLLDIATALGKVDASYTLEVYSGETDPYFYQELTKHPNVYYGGKIPYSQVQKRISECDILVVTEGFAKEDIALTRYSLSTKAADALASGTMIFAYGPEEAGLIGYLKNTGATMTCNNTSSLEECFKSLINDVNLQKNLYESAKVVTRRNHTLESSTAIFDRLIDRVIKEKDN